MMKLSVWILSFMICMFLAPALLSAQLDIKSLEREYYDLDYKIREWDRIRKQSGKVVIPENFENDLARWNQLSAQLAVARAKKSAEIGAEENTKNVIVELIKHEKTTEYALAVIDKALETLKAEQEFYKNWDREASLDTGIASTLYGQDRERFQRLKDEAVRRQRELRQQIDSLEQKQDYLKNFKSGVKGILSAKEIYGAVEEGDFVSAAEKTIDMGSDIAERVYDKKAFEEISGRLEVGKGFLDVGNKIYQGNYLDASLSAASTIDKMLADYEKEYDKESKTLQLFMESDFIDKSLKDKALQVIDIANERKSKIEHLVDFKKKVKTASERINKFKKYYGYYKMVTGEIAEYERLASMPGRSENTARLIYGMSKLGDAFNMVADALPPGLKETLGQFLEFYGNALKLGESIDKVVREWFEKRDACLNMYGQNIHNSYALKVIEEKWGRDDLCIRPAPEFKQSQLAMYFDDNIGKTHHLIKYFFIPKLGSDPIGITEEQYSKIVKIASDYTAYASFVESSYRLTNEDLMDIITSVQTNRDSFTINDGYFKDTTFKISQLKRDVEALFHIKASIGDELTTSNHRNMIDYWYQFVDSTEFTERLCRFRLYDNENIRHRMFVNYLKNRELFEEFVLRQRLTAPSSHCNIEVSLSGDRETTINKPASIMATIKNARDTLRYEWLNEADNSLLSPSASVKVMAAQEGTYRLRFNLYVRSGKTEIRLFSLPYVVVVKPGADKECVYQYSQWGECNVSTSTQTRTVISKTPEGCIQKQPPVLEQGCIPKRPEDPPCVYQYSDWSPCDEKTRQQTRKVLSKAPQGCIEKERPILEQQCAPTKDDVKNKTFSCVNPTGIFTEQPFNGLQLSYGISGLCLSNKKDREGFTQSRKFDIVGITSDTVIISGRVVPNEARCYTWAGSFWFQTDVSLTVDGQTKSWKSPLPCEKKSTEAYSVWQPAYSFNLSLPVPKDKEKFDVSFSIRQTLVNPRFGDRVVVVGGSGRVVQKISGNFIEGGEDGIPPKLPSTPLKVIITPEKTPINIQFGEILTLKAKVEGGMPGYTYKWTGDGMGKDGEFTFTKGKKAGSYTVSLTVNDSDGNSATASTTIVVEAITVKLEKLAPSGDSLIVGGKGNFRATVMAGKETARGDFVIRWEPFKDKVAKFKDRETTGTTTANEIRFMSPGDYLIYVDVLQKIDGVLQTVGESEQIPIQVINPKWEMTFEPAQPKVGQMVKAMVKASGVTAEDIKAMNFEWRFPDNAKQTGAEQRDGVGSFYLKDTKPANIQCIVRLDGENLGGVGKSITAQGYQVSISEPRYHGPKPRIWKCDTQLGGACPGLVEVADTQFAVFRDIFTKATVTPNPESPRYRWSIDPAGSCGLPGAGSEIKINCSNTGTYTAKVEVTNADGVKLGEATQTVTISISEEMLTASNKAKEAHEKLQKAKGLVNEGKLDEAINLANEAAGLDPKNTEAKTLKDKWSKDREQITRHIDNINKFIKDKKFPEAERELQGAKSLHPKYAKVIEAEKALNEAKQRHQKEVTDRLNEAKRLTKEGKIDEAVSIVQEVAKIDKPTAQPVMNEISVEAKKVGWDALSKGDYKTAIKRLEQAVALNPADTDAQNKLKGAKDYEAKMPLVESKMKEFDKLIEEKKVVSSYQKLLEVQDILRTMTMGQSSYNPVIIKYNEEYNKLNKWYNELIQKTNAEFTRLFNEQDWVKAEALLKDVLRYEHTEANKRQYESSLQMVQNNLRERREAMQYYEQAKANNTKGQPSDIKGIEDVTRELRNRTNKFKPNEPEYKQMQELIAEMEKRKKAIAAVEYAKTTFLAGDQFYRAYQYGNAAVKYDEGLKSIRDYADTNSQLYVEYFTKWKDAVAKDSRYREIVNSLSNLLKNERLDETSIRNGIAMAEEGLKLVPNSSELGGSLYRLKIKLSEIQKQKELETQKKATADRLWDECSALARQNRLSEALAKCKESLNYWSSDKRVAVVRDIENSINQEKQKKAISDRLWDECSALARQNRLSDALAKCKESLNYWSSDKRVAVVRDIENTINQEAQNKAISDRLWDECSALARQNRLNEALAKCKESLNYWSSDKRVAVVREMENSINQEAQKKAISDRLWDECSALAKQNRLNDALAKCKESLNYWSSDKRVAVVNDIESKLKQPPIPPTKPPTTTGTATDSMTNKSKGYWRLIDRKSETKKGSDCYPVDVAGDEGNIIVNMKSVCGENGIVRVRAEWTIPPERLIPNENLRVDAVLIPELISGTNRGIAEEMEIKFDNADINCGYTTAGRIKIIEGYAAGVGHSGGKRSGEVKVPEKGRFKPDNLLKLSVCSRYYHQYYTYQWTEYTSGIGSSTNATTTMPTNISGNTQVIFNNGNIAGVYNNPTKPTTFTINQPHVITLIQNYHWNNAKGSVPGTIQLRDQNGRTYGPWQAKGSPGQGGVPNAYWTVYPNITIPAGTYTVIDSEPSTWAQNSGSQGAGFTRVEGYPAGSSSSQQTTGQFTGNIPNQSQKTITAEFKNSSGNQNIHIFAEGQDSFGPHNRITPGATIKVNIKAPSHGGFIKFAAGRNGQVLATCKWEYDPNTISGRMPVVTFHEPNRLSCVTGIR